MTGSLIKNRMDKYFNHPSHFRWEKPKVSHCILEILERASNFFPIDRNTCLRFSKKYAYENSKNGGITHKSSSEMFGYGYLVNGKWSLFQSEMSFYLLEAKVYSCLETMELKTPWIDKIKEINESAFYEAKYFNFKYCNCYFCNKCGKSTKGEDRYNCKSCDMKLYHLRKKENELAVAKQLTKKLNEEIKNEIKRTTKAFN